MSQPMLADQSVDQVNGQAVRLGLRREEQLPIRDMRLLTVVAVGAWLCSVIGLLINVPDHELNQAKIERMERLLRSHCPKWAPIKDTNYIPTHELLVTKCFHK